MQRDEPVYHRRDLLRGGVALALGASAAALAACGGEETAQTAPKPAPKPAEPPKAMEPPTPAAKPPPAPAPPADAAGTGGASGDSALVTEVASAATLVASLQYVNESPKPEQQCKNCQLYTAQSDGRGKCQLFQEGLVKEAGWCISWVAKVS